MIVSAHLGVNGTIRPEVLATVEVSGRDAAGPVIAAMLRAVADAIEADPLGAAGDRPQVVVIEFP